MNDQINQAAIHLCAAQALIEDHPSVYSEELWAKLTDILSDISKLEDIVNRDENHD